MKPTSPWSVKGVEPEAREAAKLSARRADMSLGQWLSHTIRMAAKEQLKSGGIAGDSTNATQGAEAGNTATANANGAAGSAGNGAPTGNGPTETSGPPAPTTAAVLESINRLAQKIEETETRTTSTIAPIVDKVKNLSEQIEGLSKSQSDDTAPLERALSRVAERLDHLETPPDQPRGSERRGSKDGFFSKFFS